MCRTVLKLKCRARSLIAPCGDLCRRAVSQRQNQRRPRPICARRRRPALLLWPDRSTSTGATMHRSERLRHRRLTLQNERHGSAVAVADRHSHRVDWHASARSTMSTEHQSQPGPRRWPKQDGGAGTISFWRYRLAHLRCQGLCAPASTAGHEISFGPHGDGFALDTVATIRPVLARNGQPGRSIARSAGQTRTLRSVRMTNVVAPDNSLGRSAGPANEWWTRINGENFATGLPGPALRRHQPSRPIALAHAWSPGRLTAIDVRPVLSAGPALPTVGELYSLPDRHHPFVAVPIPISSPSVRESEEL